MNCLFEDYIKFVDSFLSNYYRILFENRYERRLIRPFIDKYISVRYYNEYVVKGTKFTDRLNRELNNVAKEMIHENEEKTEKIKNIFALFSYLLYIEKCDNYVELNNLIKTLFEDKTITLEYSDNTKEELNNLVRNYFNKKNEFFKLFESNEFELSMKKYPSNVYLVDLKQNCSLSKLYSDYAIEKAYDSEVVFENRVYLELLMLSSRVIKDIIDINFKNNYVIDFPPTLFGKQKKILKYLKTLDNEFLKTKINLKFKYKDYKENKKEINNLINEGYSVCLELDETYDIDFSNLLLFSYIFVNKKYNYYDIIINSKEDVKTEIITL